MMIKTSVKLALWGLAAFCISAQALEFKLNTVLPGDPVPPNASPWLTVGITSDPGDADWVDLKFTANLVGNEKIGGIYLNFEPSQALSGLDFFQMPMLTSGVAFPEIKAGANSWDLPGDGSFDLYFDFTPNTADAFDGTDWITIQVRGTGPLDPAMFDFLSEKKGGNDRFGYLAGAHLQALPNGDASTSIVPGPSVPDTFSTLTLLSLGLGALSALGRKLRE